MIDDAAPLLAEAEHTNAATLLADAEDGIAARLVAEAEETIEAWLCELDEAWIRILEDAHVEARRVVQEARSRAAEVVGEAEDDARAVLAGAGKLAAIQLAEAEAEAHRTRQLAAESRATARAIAVAADATVSGRVQVDDLVALGHAVERLRIELSRVIDAAFDALPAVEATAAALAVDPLPPVAAPRPRGLLRRLLRAA